MKVLKFKSKFVSDIKTHGPISHCTKNPVENPYDDIFYLLRVGYRSIKKNPFSFIVCTTIPAKAISDKDIAEKEKNNAREVAQGMLDNISCFLKDFPNVESCKAEGIKRFEKEPYFQRCSLDSQQRDINKYFQEPRYTQNYKTLFSWKEQLQKFIDNIEKEFAIVEIEKMPVFSGKASPNDKNQARFVKTKTTDICDICKIYIPTDSHLQVNRSVSKKGLVKICPFCLEGISQTNNEIAENFKKENDSYYDAYTGEIVVKSL